MTHQNHLYSMSHVYSKGVFNSGLLTIKAYNAAVEMFFGRYFGICIYILPDSLPIQYSRLDELCVKSLSACLD